MKTEWKYLTPTPPLAKAEEAINDYAAQSRQALAAGHSSNANVPSSVDGWTERINDYTTVAMANNAAFARLGPTGGKAYQDSEYGRSFDFAMITAGAAVALEHQDAVVRKDPKNKVELIRYSALALAMQASQGAYFAFGNPTPDKAPTFS